MAIQALRNRDKMEDDAIAQLSDQVMALTARMQETRTFEIVVYNRTSFIITM